MALSTQSLPTNISPDVQREMLRQMLTIRRFEERASADYLAGKVYGVVHCYIGEEAVAVGVCSALDRGDRIISTHRGHGHCIAKGADLNRMMAELYGRQTGYCKGKGGSMHIADFAIGMLGANGIVAGGISIITGAGLAAQMEGKGGVAVSFFGDGASSAAVRPIRATRGRSKGGCGAIRSPGSSGRSGTRASSTMPGSPRLSATSRARWQPPSPSPKPARSRPRSRRPTTFFRPDRKMAD